MKTLKYILKESLLDDESELFDRNDETMTELLNKRILSKIYEYILKSYSNNHWIIDSTGSPNVFVNYDYKTSELSISLKNNVTGFRLSIDVDKFPEDMRSLGLNVKSLVVDDFPLIMFGHDNSSLENINIKANFLEIVDIKNIKNVTYVCNNRGRMSGSMINPGLKFTYLKFIGFSGGPKHKTKITNFRFITQASNPSTSLMLDDINNIDLIDLKTNIAGACTLCAFQPTTADQFQDVTEVKQKGITELLYRTYIKNSLQFETRIGHKIKPAETFYDVLDYMSQPRKYKIIRSGDKLFDCNFREILHMPDLNEIHLWHLYALGPKSSKVWCEKIRVVCFEVDNQGNIFNIYKNEL